MKSRMEATEKLGLEQRKKHEGAYIGLHDVDNVGNEGQRVVLRLRVASMPRQIEPEVNSSTMEHPT